MKRMTLPQWSARHGGWALLWAAVATLASFAATALTITAADYARAERFLFWNKDTYVSNADIQHHWIGNEDRFWYLRTTPQGDKQFVVVDAASGHRTPAFDQQKLADSLSKLTGKKVEPGKLPFTVFRFVQNNKAIQFETSGALWICQTETAACQRDTEQVRKPNQSASPDGKWAVYIRDHNLWAHARSGDAPDFQLTTDGVEHFEYGLPPGDNREAITDQRRPEGVPPEVLWSPDSNSILTYRLDERKVKDLWLVQASPGDLSSRPKLYTYRYAMPGDENVATVRLVIIRLDTHRQVEVETPLYALGWGLLSTGYSWWSADSKRVYFLKRARFSKSVSLNVAEAATAQVREILQESGSTPVRVSDGNTGVWSKPSVKILKNGDVIWFSERDGWGHLYYYDGARGKLRNQITKGEWVVRGIAHVDESAHKIYFLASGRPGARDPYEQRLYRINYDGSGLQLLTPEDAEHTGTVEEPPPVDDFVTPEEKEQFAPSGRYFLDSFSWPDTPPVFVLRKADGRLVAELERADVSKLASGGRTPIESFQVLAADGKTPIYGNLFRPSTFNPANRYPIIDSDYPGPQVARTSRTFASAVFDGLDAQALAELGFVVVTIDGRGTPHRSKAFLDYSYGNLGKASDFEDHIAGLRQLAQRYPYLDIDRVGIEGVSGGGFAALHAILAYPDFYKVAVSASGNHEQRNLYAFWGETYMGPLNQDVYKEASYLGLAGNLKGKLLLMHGEMDDNVPPAMTLKVAKALIDANKDFEMLIMPDYNHGAAMSPYFIRRKWDFFVRNLLGADPPAQYVIQQPESVRREYAP